MHEEGVCVLVLFPQRVYCNPLGQHRLNSVLVYGCFLVFDSLRLFGLVDYLSAVIRSYCGINLVEMLHVEEVNFATTDTDKGPPGTNLNRRREKNLERPRKAKNPKGRQAICKASLWALVKECCLRQTEAR